MYKQNKLQMCTVLKHLVQYFIQKMIISDNNHIGTSRNALSITSLVLYLLCIRMLDFVSLIVAVNLRIWSVFE